MSRAMRKCIFNEVIELIEKQKKELSDRKDIDYYERCNREIELENLKAVLKDKLEGEG